ncbi:MAG: hypothetical protein IJM97_01410 [Clostridia bacterium]|nr:hypothetical protein [Clostridia bacterium]
MSIVDEAREYRTFIEAKASTFDDKEASQVVKLYPKLSESGELIKAGTRINWNGILKRASVDLWDTEENNPDNAPALWEDIEYRDGYRIIPDVITVGTAFAKNEIGWWENELYQSTLDANVFTPQMYPAGWNKLSEVI